MLQAFLTDNFEFQRYSTEHWTSLLFWLLFGFAFIVGSKRYLDRAKQEQYILYFTLFIAIAQCLKIALRLYTDTFNILTDLPFHLCNFVPFGLLIAYYYKSQKIWSVVFIWIMIGTLQANFTPTLDHSLPHFDAFRYWINHCGLVVAALYPAFLWGYQLKWKDLYRSLFWLNVVALFMYFMNLLIGSNYMYLMHKPAGKTFFDLLGPWPYYLITCEFAFFVLGGIVWLPFFLKKRKKQQTKLILQAQ